jgi:hypothetical protein
MPNDASPLIVHCGRVPSGVLDAGPAQERRLRGIELCRGCWPIESPCYGSTQMSTITHMQHRGSSRTVTTTRHRRFLDPASCLLHHGRITTRTPASAQCQWPLSCTLPVMESTLVHQRTTAYLVCGPRWDIRTILQT